MFENKKILITGGTGSLGIALTARLLKTDVDTIRIFSRDELKQSQMESNFNDERLRFLIGDVRDKERLEKAVEGINIVIHTAALKQVPVIEYNPFEAIKTNVQGSQNLVDACLEKDVEFALAIGTDKAVSPFNTYGATKLLMERLFVSANYHKGAHKTKFACVRYGNVLGSRGSIIPKFID
jgi:UDP-N-acetylglucosamine 4,6-dehydratase/UDP-glucose 4-epimerase